MSRWIEDGKDEHGRYYLETLKDSDGCRWQMNDVCCNGDNREMVGDFPFGEDCNESCPYFKAEPADEIEALKEGKKTYECREERGSDE